MENDIRAERLELKKRIRDQGQCGNPKEEGMGDEGAGADCGPLFAYEQDGEENELRGYNEKRDESALRC